MLFGFSLKNVDTIGLRLLQLFSNYCGNIANFELKETERTEEKKIKPNSIYSIWLTEICIEVHLKQSCRKTWSILKICLLIAFLKVSPEQNEEFKIGKVKIITNKIQWNFDIENLHLLKIG